MQSFRHIEAPLRLFAGLQSLQSLNRELARLDCRRAVILCGRSLAKGPDLDLVRLGAGDRLAEVCDGVRPHSPRSAVQAVAERLATLEADAVIAVGGGSAAVTARAAVIALGEAAPLDALATTRDVNGRLQTPRLDAPKLPIFAVPTTPTTATVKPGTAIFDEASGMRLALFDPKTRPQAVFLEPALLMTAPPELHRNAALNTLSSAIEGLVSATADQLALGDLSQAVDTTAARLTEGTDLPDKRTDLAIAAVLCGRGTDHTGMGLATVISHAIATSHDIDAGLAKAIALPHVLHFNRDHIAAGLRRLSVALGAVDEDAIGSCTRLFAGLEIPGRLRDLGVSKDALPQLAETCMADWFTRTNPRPIEGPGTVLELLEDAW